MEKYKILVNNEAKSREAQELFFELGCKSENIDKYDYPQYLANYNDFTFSNYVIDAFLDDWMEITLPQLRDKVVLKRNSVDDANRINHRGEPVYSSSDNIDHIHDNGKWVKSYYQAKPIEKEMKEYLDSGKCYAYVQSDVKRSDDWIEVPEGAEIALKHKDVGDVYFYKDNYKLVAMSSVGTWSRICFDCNVDNKLLFMINNFGSSILWQRPQQPEPLPFIDDVTLETATGSQLDSLAEHLCLRGRYYGESDADYRYQLQHYIGKPFIDDEPCINHVQKTLDERQATYGSFEDVARTTEQIMEAMSSVRPNGLKDLPHPHRMALYMIASKMSRIVNGDYNHKDSWHDIQGYARLVEDLL